MQSQYPVYYHNQKSGEVTVEKEGLYYRFFCRAQLPDGTRCHLIVHTADKRHDLGLCVPQGKYFAAQTRLPVKYFSQGACHFSLEQTGKERFVPLYPDQPFPALGDLEQGKFACRDEVCGIIFPEGTQSGDALADWLRGNCLL